MSQPRDSPPPTKVARREHVTVGESPLGRADSHGTAFAAADVLCSGIGRHIAFAVTATPAALLVHWWALHVNACVNVCSVPSDGTDFVPSDAVEGCGGRTVILVQRRTGLAAVVPLSEDTAVVTPTPLLPEPAALGVLCGCDGVLWAAPSTGGAVRLSQLEEAEGDPLLWTGEPAHIAGAPRSGRHGWLSRFLGRPSGAAPSAPLEAIDALFPSAVDSGVAFAVTGRTVRAISVDAQLALAGDAGWVWSLDAAATAVDSVLDVVHRRTGEVWVLALTPGHSPCVLTLSDPDVAVAVADYPNATVEATDPASLHVLGDGAFCVVSSLVTLSGGRPPHIGAPERVEHHARTGRVFAASRRDNRSWLLTARGPSRLPADAVHVGQAAAPAPSAPTLPLPGQGDSAWLAASATAATETEVNPSNWAKGDIDADDHNLLTFVTKSLNERVLRHSAVLCQLRASPAAWATLKPATRASLLSAQEQLSVLAALRALQNSAEGQPSVADARALVLKRAVAAVATRCEERTGASISELAYSTPANAAVFLEAVTMDLQRTVLAQAPLAEKVLAAHAGLDVWLAALNAIQQARAEAPPAEEGPLLWTAAACPAAPVPMLEAHCRLCSDVLVFAADSAAVAPPPVEDALLGAVVGQLGLLLRGFAALHTEGSAVADGLLRATLFRPPFTAAPVGYPHGPPQPAPLVQTSLATEAIAVAVSVAEDLCVLPVLWDCAGAAEVEAPLSNPAAYGTMRRYALEAPGFFAHALRSMVAWHREEEIAAICDLIPDVAEGDSSVVRAAILAEHAPDVHWLVDPAATSSLLVESTLGLSAGAADTALEHRLRMIALGRVSWFAQGRPESLGFLVDTEAMTARAQGEHLPTITARPLRTDECVRALLQSSHTAWPTAAALCDRISDDDTRERLLRSVLAACHGHDAAAFSHVMAQGGGEAEQAAFIGQSTTGCVLGASRYLRSAAAAKSPSVAEATDPSFAAVLQSWVSAEGIAAAP